MQIVPLGASHLDALTELASRPPVARYGEHLPSDPAAAWDAWLGPPDPHRRLTIGVTRGGALACAARLSTSAHRRRSHVGGIDVLAPWGDDDDAVDLAVRALVEVADRWMQLSRLEMIQPAGHPRVARLLAPHGFQVECTMRESILRDGVYADEVGLARLRAGTPTGGEKTPPPAAPPPSDEPDDLRIRPVRPADAAAWSAGLSEEAVVWGTLQLPYQRPEVWEARLSENDPQEVFLLGAEVGGDLVAGGALLVQKPFRRRHVASVGMHVRAAFQGRGIGGRLMREVLALGRELGLRRLELEVYPDNSRAVRLYEVSGFVNEGRRINAAFREGEHVDDRVMSILLR